VAPEHAIFKPTRDRGIRQFIRKIEDEVRPRRPSVDIADLGFPVSWKTALGWWRTP
jgi:hypothetical protein